MRLQVRLLGALEVLVDGQPVRVSGRPAVLLVVLAMSAGRAVSLDMLAEAVWGADLPRNPRASVHTYLTRLRGLLGTDVIESGPAGYVLRAEVDAVHFVRLLDQGDAATERQRLAEALALWRDVPFGGVESSWLEVVEAPRLIERFITAAQRRIDLDLDAGRIDGLAVELVELTSRFPLREPLVARLLRVLDRSGRRAEALERFEAFRVRLAEELGADPGPELRAFHAHLLSAALEPAQPSGSLQAAVVPRQLPVDVAGFVGRDEALKVLDGLLDGSVSGTLPPLSIAAVSGAAGIGKSALVVHWAHRTVSQFPDGQLYANLRGFDPSGAPRQPSEVLRGFLSGLGVPAGSVPEEVEARASLFRSVLSGRRVLVVLDNARDAEQVRPLLPGAPGCLVVVTSRGRLTSLVAGEGARPVSLDVLSAAEARQLLNHRIGPRRVGAEPAATDEIISRCAALPLALTVVAARAALQPDYPLSRLASQLRATRVDLSAFHEPDPAADLRAVFSWSFETVGEAAARLFRLLGLHPGPDLGEHAAASLAGVPVAEARSLLTELTRASLLAETVPGRYSFHDLLRAFAVEQTGVHETGQQRRDATQRLLAYFVHSGHAATLALNSQREPITLAACPHDVTPESFGGHVDAFQWFTSERSALQAMMGKAIESGYDSYAWQLAWVLNEGLDRQGCWHEIIDTQMIAIAAADRLGDREAAAQARRYLARGYGLLSRFEEAHASLRKALELYGSQGNHTGRANTHRSISWIYGRQDLLDKAIEHALHALHLFQESDDQAGVGRALNSLGWMHSRLGQHEQAVAYCQQALPLHRAAGTPYSLAATWDSLGVAEHHLGRHTEAIACYQQALEILDGIGARYSKANALVHLGDTHVAVGDVTAAREVWLQAVDILIEFGHADAGVVQSKLEALPAS